MTTMILTVFMAAKQFDADNSSEYLLLTMKKEQYPMPYLLGHLEAPVVVKHRRTSVPNVYYHSTSEGVSTLHAVGLD